MRPGVCCRWLVVGLFLILIVIIILIQMEFDLVIMVSIMDYKCVGSVVWAFAPGKLGEESPDAIG